MAAEQDNLQYSEQYSEEGFWSKLAEYALAAGSQVVEYALRLYYAAQDPRTPAWAKSVIVGALGYFITPLDAIPDLVPAVGYADDLGVLAMALGTVAMYITPEIRARAAQKKRDWFGEPAGAPGKADRG